MTRIQPLQPTQANEQTQKLLDGVQRGLGMVPNMFRTLAHSSAALSGYLSFHQALSGALTPVLREKISLAVAGCNGCDYCASAHTLLGSKAGIPDAELADNLSGQSSDQRTQAALTFARAVVESRGRVGDADVNQLKAEGFTEAEIVEVISVVALNVFTNYFNLVADPEIDLPVVAAATASAT